MSRSRMEAVEMGTSYKGCVWKVNLQDLLRGCMLGLRESEELKRSS